MDVSTVMKEIGTWPFEDRLRLIEEVWDSLSDHSLDSGLTETHKQDLQRRLEAYRDNPKAGAPWEDVKARLRGKQQ